MPSIEPHCPKCRTSVLEEKSLSDGTPIDVCSQCRGGWFDSKELASVLTVAVTHLDPPDDAPITSRVCPKCLIPLKQLPYPETQIEVDVCDVCHGIWLDRGEFRSLNVARSRYQDDSKFTEPPATFKEAVTSFVDRILIKFGD